MKTLAIFFVSIALSCSSNAQVIWRKYLGGSGIDIANSIQQTKDSGFIFAGCTTSNDGNVTTHHDNYDYWIVKLTQLGNIQWQRSFGGDNWDQANSVVQTFDGGYIATGFTRSTDGDISGNHGGTDYWVIKLSSSGDLEWQKCFGGSNEESAYSVIQTFDSNYVITGSSHSSDGDVSGNHGTNYWIIKITNTGLFQWQRCLGGSSIYGENACSLIQTSDTGYIVAGYGESNDFDVAGNHGQTDGWIVKLSSAGIIQWQKCIGGSGFDEIRNIKQTPDGGYIVCGSSESTDGDVSGNHGNDDYWVVKLSASGDIQWQKCYGNTGDDQAQAISPTSDGGYIVSGLSYPDPDRAFAPDYWILKLSASGDMQWQKFLGGAVNATDFSDIHQTFDGNYIFCGNLKGSYIVGADNDHTFHGQTDAWIVKLGPDVGVNDLHKSSSVAIHPNPTTGMVYLTGIKSATVKISNLLGQILTEEKITDHFSISGFPSGIYFIKVFDDNDQLLVQDKLVKN